MNRKTGVLLSYGLMIFEVLSTLLLTPFIIRTLGQAEYGVYKLAAAINAYLLLLDLGVGNAIIRYIAKFRATKDHTQERLFLGVATIYYTVIALIALIAGTVLVAVFPTAFAKGLTPDEIKLGQTLLSVTMANSAITLGTAAYNNVIIAYERFYVSKGLSIIVIIIRMLLTYTALRFGMGSIGIVSVNLLTTILSRGYFVVYVLGKMKLKPAFRGIQMSFIKEIVVYSSLILLQMVATQLNATVDQVLIGSLVASSAAFLAVYSVGTQIVQYYQSVGSAFTGVLMPGIVKMVENKASPEQITDEMIRIGRIIFLGLSLIWGVFLVNGQEFVILWGGSANRQSYVVAIILMTAYLFILTESIGTQVLWAMNEHKEQAFLKITIVLINILLTILLIKWEPLIGATIGTFISLMLGDVGVMNWVFVRKLKMKLGYYYKGLFQGIVPSVILMIVFGVIIKAFLPTGWGWFVMKSLIMVIIYTVAILLFGTNHYEKSLIISLLKKLQPSVKKQTS